MENGTPKLAQASADDTSPEYRATLAKQVARESFEALLTMLGASSHGDVVQLFAGRVEHHTVVDWRRRRRAVPRWAWGYLATLLRQRAGVLLTGAEIAENPPMVAPGQGSHRNIAAWNARRAALKAKMKEGAG
jgi:hypothetical protein